MPYVPRAATTIKCAHCKKPFESRHASRKYCSNSCNVLASYERTGYRGEPRATRADLEKTVAKLMALVNVKPELVASKQATKIVAEVPAKKRAAKATTKQKPKAATPVKEPSSTTTKSAKKTAKQRVKAERPVVQTIRL